MAESFQAPPQGPQPDDLSASMQNLNIAQSTPAPRAKRPARVFHTEFSQDVAPPNAPGGPSQFTPASAYANNHEFTSPMDQIMEQHRLGSPMDSAMAAHRSSPQQQQPQRQIQQQTLDAMRNLDKAYRQTQDSQAQPVNIDKGDLNGVIPSIVADRAAAQSALRSEPVFKTFENACPPSAGTEYDVQDQGLSGPQYARLTMYNVPSSEQLRALTKLPLGMTLRPLAPFSNKEFLSGGVSVADFSDGVPPPRCTRCRAYMNPSMLFVEGGTQFICNHCQFSNETSAEYFQPTDAAGRRIDWQTRPELAFGTYDMIVGEEYWRNETTPPSSLNHLILIDVSRDAIKKEIPYLAVEAIRALLYGGPFDAGEHAKSNFSTEETLVYDSNGNLVDPASLFDTSIKLPPKTKIGFATYDKTVHFYNLNASLEQAQMLVMSDIEDSFVPLEEGMFVDPEESRLVIEDLLDRLQSIFANNVYEEPVFGCALDVALKALKSTGGKVSAILTSLPSRGPGSLAIRGGDPKFAGENEKDLYKADSKFYEDLGKQYAQAGVGLDLHLFSSAQMDLANTGVVCQLSGGNEFYYPHFIPQRDGRQFISNFCKASEGEIGTEAVLKVRCSTGLQVAAYYGNFYHENWDDDPRFGTVDSKTTIGVLFQYDGKLDSKLDAHFQSALLYTTSSGQRRVRVTNVIASVTEQFRPVVNFVDMDACLGVLARDSLGRMSEISLKDIRAKLTDKLVDVFLSYRKHVASTLPPNQLLMPVSLRSFIALILALQKSLPFADQRLLIDYRVHSARKMKNMTPDELSLYLYPCIIGLHNLQDEDCTYSPEGFFNMPLNVKASMSALQAGGVYMTFNGQCILLWIQHQVSPNLLRDLFGENATDFKTLDPYINELPELDTAVSIKARALIKHFANQATLRFLGIRIARESLDQTAYEFQSQLVEDRTGGFTYSEFMTNVHREVKNRLENGNEKGTKPNFFAEHFWS